MAIPEEISPVLAAAIAAVVALFTALITILAQRHSERREAYRIHLGDQLSNLSEAMHELVASSAKMGRASADADVKNWHEKALCSARRLDALRRRLRYPLWGLDTALFTLGQSPLYMLHAKADPRRVEVTIALATSLRTSIDRAVRKAYLYGRSPGQIDLLASSWRAKALVRAFKNRSPKPDSNELEL